MSNISNKYLPKNLRNIEPVVVNPNIINGVFLTKGHSKYSVKDNKNRTHCSQTQMQSITYSQNENMNKKNIITCQPVRVNPYYLNALNVVSNNDPISKIEVVNKQKDSIKKKIIYKTLNIEMHKSIMSKLSLMLKTKLFKMNQTKVKFLVAKHLVRKSVKNLRKKKNIEHKWPKLLPIQEQLDILKKYYTNTDEKYFNRSVCSVCGIFFMAKLNEKNSYPIEFLLKYKDLLSKENLYDVKFEQDEFKYRYSYLNDMVLNSEGLDFDKKLATICKSCHKTLKSNKLPKFAMANNLYIGNMPEELKELTVVEQSLIARNCIKACVFKINVDKQDSQLKMRGNIITFPQNPDTILSLLPSIPAAEHFQVAFVGKIKPDFTNNFPQSIKKIFRVRRQKIENALKWLNKYNPFYKNVIISKENLDALPDDDIPKEISEEFVYLQSDDSEFSKVGYDNINRETDQFRNINEDIIELRSTGLSNSIENINIDIIEQLDKIKHAYDTKSKNNTDMSYYLKMQHGDTPISEINNPSHLICAFPSLFPYGLGGVSDSRRKIKISYREHINYLLRLSCERFRTHQSFMFIAFNIIQRMEARKNMNLLIKQQDFKQLATEIESLSKEDFENAIQILKNPTTKQTIDPRINRLLCKIQSTSAKVQGSKASLKHRRNDIRSYIIAFGPPQIFITINPADIHNPLLFKIGGVNITETILNNYKIRSSFLKKNPYIQAMFFDTIIQNFIKYILGFESTKNTGLLGTLKAFYGMNEPQDRGSLHIHMLIWLKNAPNPNELKDLLKNPDFKSKLLKWLESIIHCDFQELVTENNNNEENIHPCIKSPDYVLCEDLEEKYRSFLKDVFQVSKATVIHKCNKTCYKYYNGNNVCRFGFGSEGKELVEKSYINSNGNIQLKRQHKFVNEFNWIVSAALRCNHDIKFIGKCSNQSLSVLYYLTNYMTKSGISCYESAVLASIAHDKINKYDNDQSDKYQKLKRLISACFNAATNNTEYSGAMVASMLLNNGRDGTHYSSNQTICLNIYPIINELKNESSEKFINIKKAIVTMGLEEELYDYFADYKFRSNKLKHISLYEFYKNYTIIKKTKSSNGIRFNFKKKYKKFNKFDIKLSETERVPVIICPDIPSKDNMDKRDLYNQIISILFIPWFSLQNIKDSIEKGIDSHRHKNNIKGHINNIEYLKKALHDAEDEKKYTHSIDSSVINLHQESMQYITPYDEENTNIFEFDEFEQESNFIKQQQIREFIQITKENDWSNDAINQYNLINSTPENHANILLEEPSDININSFLIDSPVYTLNMHKWKKTIMTSSRDTNNNIIEMKLQLNNKVTDIDKQSCMSKESTEPSVEIVYRTTNNLENETIKKYNLNTKQIKAFKTFVEPLTSACDQRLIYLYGAGGTGKSMVINAIKYYFEKSNNYHALELSAPTGAASELIDGDTLHKTVKLKINKQINNDPNKIKLKQYWSNKSFLIIDENSMLGKKRLAEINKNLQIAKGNDLDFGGVNILFCGDFVQFNPIKDEPVWKKSKLEHEQKSIKNFLDYSDAEQGRLLWRSLTHCIKLTEQMRQSDDKDFSALLDRLREDTVTNESLEDDYQKLNSRIINNINPTELKKWKDAPIIVSRNKLRDKLNIIKIKKYAENNKITVYNCAAIDSKSNKESNKELTENNKKMIHELTEKQSNNLMTDLPLVQGARYIITKNISTKSGLTNGTLVELVNVEYNNNKYNNNNNNNLKPEFILVRKVKGKNKLHFDGLEHDLIPIFPTTSTFTVHPNYRYLGTKSFRVKRTQFPLTPAYVLTAHRAQGSTYDKIIIDLKRPISGNLDFAYLYVTLSRARRLQDIIILRKFNKDIFKVNIPLDLKDEFKRLGELEN